MNSRICNEADQSRICEAPVNLSEAKKCPNWEQWAQAVDEELQYMKKSDVFEEVGILKDHQVISTRFVFTQKFSNKTKTARCKARLVVRGFEMKSKYTDTFPPTPHLDTLRFLIPYCASKSSAGYPLFSVNFVSAFLNAISDLTFT